eukprot:CAMPEP_0196723984 /NCGR_PEP_ID=MMETSP1091-20130531/6026_1 /TAXON_ID=302021 /ORGANISM="Rhodomonas sp., Strain CCMP768" /LENGTH=35 /DNA_ID= /DNA_START= /DNA_END= /DNA_ORIENTATION=
MKAPPSQLQVRTARVGGHSSCTDDDHGAFMGPRTA